MKTVIFIIAGSLLFLVSTAFAANIDGGYSQNGGSSTFFGETTNNSSMFLSNAALLIDGPFINNGAFITSGSTLNVNGDVTVGTAGYFQGVLGDVYTFHGSYFNQSNSALWDTSNVDLVMTSDGDISVNGAVGLFRNVTITAGGTITLNGSISSAENLWVSSGNFVYSGGNSSGEGGGSIFITGNDGLITVTESGGPITVTPEPISSVLFLVGSGVFGVAAHKRRKSS